MRYIMFGWPETQIVEEFNPYRPRWKELSTLDGCILWGSGVGDTTARPKGCIGGVE